MSYTSVLIIDDDHEDIEFLRGALEKINPAIVCTGIINGQQGLEWLHTAENKPSHVFLDLRMPGMEGLDCLEAIKKHPAFADIKVVIYSNYEAPTDRRYTEAVGSHPLLNKHHTLSNLCDELKLIMEQ